MPIYTNGPLTESTPSMLDIEPSTGEYLGASIEGAFENLPTTMAVGRAMALQQDAYGERLTRQDATRELTRNGLTMEVPDSGISRFELESMIALHQHERARQQVFARNQSYANYLLGTTAYIGAGVVDPVNVASAMLPVISEARYLELLDQASSYVGRLGVRAGVGAVRGAAGAAVIEPFNYDLERSWGRDYGPIDSFTNIVLGGPFGAGLHVIGGAGFEAYQGGWRPSRLRDFAGVAPDDLKRTALKQAVEAMERDGPVAAERIFADHLQQRFGTTDDEFLGRAIDFDESTLAAARATVAMARGGENDVPPASLLQAVRTLGGIKVRDANGDLTREGMEILAALGDYRAPGIINNKTGKAPDYVREALTEDGWFGSRETGATDLQHLYDGLEATARGERVVRVGETQGKRLKTEAAAELARAGVTDEDTMRQAAMKLAERRTIELRERMADVAGEPDFAPSEIIWREPGDETLGPLSEEDLSRYEPLPPDRLFEEPDEPTVTTEAKDPLTELQKELEDLKGEIDGEPISQEEAATMLRARGLAEWAELRAQLFEATALCMRGA